MRHSNMFQWYLLSRPGLYCYRFFPSLSMKQVPENDILVSDGINQKKISSQCILTTQIEPVQD